MKKLFISLMLISAVMGMNAVMADEGKAPVESDKAIHKPMAHHYIGDVPPAARYFGPGPQIDKKHPVKMHTPRYFDKAAMEAKKAEMEKRLKLTEEQKKQIEENKIKDREQLKPVMEQIKAKKQEIRDVIESTKLSDEEKTKKTDALLKELKALKVQANTLRKENMKNFESVLTEKQKKEFEKIKQEQKKEMKKRRKNFKKPHADILPVEPKPQPVEK